MKFYFSLVALMAVLSACDPEEICDPDAVLLDELEASAVSGGQEGLAGVVKETGQSIDDGGRQAKQADAMREALKNVGNTINFAYDSSEVTPAAKLIIDRQVAWLHQNPSVSVTIQGHCDERGTIEYNVALGERRAEAVKTYMVFKGVTQGRIKVISFGKEKPLIPGAQTDNEHHANRRAETQID